MSVQSGHSVDAAGHSAVLMRLAEVSVRQLVQRCERLRPLLGGSGVGYRLSPAAANLTK